MSPEALRVFGCGPHEPVTLRTLLRMVPHDDRRGLLRAAARGAAPRLGAGHRRAHRAARRPPAHHPRRGRARVQRARPRRRLHRHRAGRDRPPRGRGQDPPPGQLRRADRPAQPAPADLARRARARAGAPPGPPVRAAADRPGPLQDHQRHAGPRRRRRAAGGGGAPPARLRAPQRPGHGGRARSRRRRARTARWRRWAGWAATSSSRCCPRWPTSTTPSAWPQRMLEAMREPIFVGGQECFVTASVGVALFPRDGASVADLLRNSDVAMYSVKAQGSNVGGHLQPAAGRPRPREARARKRAAQGHRARRTGAALPAQDRRARRAHGGRRGADALAARRRAWCRRATSSRWPRKPA